MVDFKKAKLKVKFIPARDLLIATLPYYNTSRIIRYVLIVILNNLTGNRQIWIETTTLEGNPMYCEQVQSSIDNAPMDGESFFRGLEFTDLSQIEKWIKKFEEHLVDNQKSGNYNKTLHATY